MIFGLLTAGVFKHNQVLRNIFLNSNAPISLKNNLKAIINQASCQSTASNFQDDNDVAEDLYYSEMNASSSQFSNPSSPPIVSRVEEFQLLAKPQLEKIQSTNNSMSSDYNTLESPHVSFKPWPNEFLSILRKNEKYI